MTLTTTILLHNPSLEDNKMTSTQFFLIFPFYNNLPNNKLLSQRKFIIIF